MADAAGKPFRAIDTGLRGGRANIAFDQALIDARKDGSIPDTIRFLRFRPSALIGVHQILSHEIKLDYCKSHGIEIVRRITGGGGLYFDEGQIGWELVYDRAALGTSDLAEATRRICEAAALGLNKIGVPARHRPRSDLEVDGRKISGSGGYLDGNVVFYQGTLLIDFDPAKMVACLKLPVPQPSAAPSPPRIVTMRELLRDQLPDLKTIYDALLAGFAEGLGIAPRWGAITPHEEELAARILREEIGTDAYVEMLDAPDPGANAVSASLSTNGGTLRADIRLEGRDRNLIREVLLTGDFIALPPRTILDLEAALRGVDVADAGDVTEHFFTDERRGFVSVAPGDFRQVIVMALDRRNAHAANS